MENKFSQEEILKQQSNTELTVSAMQSFELSPGQSHTFYAREGKNYRVIATNIDDSYVAKTEIFDGDWGHIVGKLTLDPFQSGSVGVTMTKQMGVRVYNTSEEKSPGRPKITYSLYNA